MLRHARLTIRSWNAWRFRRRLSRHARRLLARVRELQARIAEAEKRHAPVSHLRVELARALVEG